MKWEQEYNVKQIHGIIHATKPSISYSCLHFHHIEIKRDIFNRVTWDLICSCRRWGWSIRSSAEGNSLNSFPAEDASGETRLIRTIKSFQIKINKRIKQLRQNLPMKLFFFLVGFYCATAFATVIGQTGDWDILSAALAVAIVEGIGALMYGASIPLVGNTRSLITMFNYWKAGLSLGLFLDSFKY